MSLATALAAVPLFSGLTEEQLATVAGYLRRRRFDERTVIVRRDSPGDALYILVSGKVKVSYLDEEQGETILAVFSAGDFFGEFAVLDGGGRSADVIALEPTEVLMLSAEDVHACLNAFPAIAIALLRELAGRLRRSTEWIRCLSSQDVYGRIAGQLLHLARTQGTDVPGGGRRIGLRLTQNDLAGIVGASRESVNKAMGYFKSKGYIAVDAANHQITVLNREALEKRCR
jgi:CRP-like cAMP-binding protein